jgi:hypothetical protein
MGIKDKGFHSILPLLERSHALCPGVICSLKHAGYKDYYAV